jgi:hypothetical protein
VDLSRLHRHPLHPHHVHPRESRLARIQRKNRASQYFPSLDQQVPTPARKQGKLVPFSDLVICTTLPAAHPRGDATRPTPKGTPEEGRRGDGEGCHLQGSSLLETHRVQTPPDPDRIVPDAAVFGDLHHAFPFCQIFRGKVVPPQKQQKHKQPHFFKSFIALVILLAL